MMLNQIGEAKGVLLKAHELDPRSTGIIADLASTMAQTGQTREAESLLRRSLWLQPKRPLLIALSYLLIENGRYGEALECATSAIEENPTFADTYAAAASVLLEMDRPMDAIEQFDVALEFNPTALEWRAIRGVALNVAGRHDEAVSEFESIMNIEPTYFVRPDRHTFLRYYEASKNGEISTPPVHRTST